MNSESSNYQEELEEMLGKRGEYFVFQYESQLVEFLASEFVFLFYVYEFKRAGEREKNLMYYRLYTYI